MEIKFERDEKGNLIAIDKKTKKKIGEVVTMGDILDEDKK